MDTLGPNSSPCMCCIGVTSFVTYYANKNVEIYCKPYLPLCMEIAVKTHQAISILSLKVSILFHIFKRGQLQVIHFLITITVV